jgi:thioredoxin 1
MRLTELVDGSLAGFLGSSNQPTVLTFHASWSKPARTMLPVLEEVAAAYDGMVRFAIADVEHTRLAVSRYGILSLPTYLIFKGGRLSDRFIGLLTKEKLTERIETSLEEL